MHSEHGQCIHSLYPRHHHRHRCRLRPRHRNVFSFTEIERKRSGAKKKQRGENRDYIHIHAHSEHVYLFGSKCHAMSSYGYSWLSLLIVSLNHECDWECSISTSPLSQCSIRFKNAIFTFCFGLRKMCYMSDSAWKKNITNQRCQILCIHITCMCMVLNERERERDSEKRMMKLSNIAHCNEYGRTCIKIQRIPPNNSKAKSK